MILPPFTLDDSIVLLYAEENIYKDNRRNVTNKNTILTRKFFSKKKKRVRL